MPVEPATARPPGFFRRKPASFISFSIHRYHELSMTSSSHLLRSIITGVFILFILAIFPAIIFPAAGTGPVPAPLPAPVSPHAFVVTMAEVPPLEAFQNVTLYKLMSPARAQENIATYPITEDLSLVNISPGEGTRPHILLGTPEVMYLLDGTATVCANGSMTEVSAGELVFIPGDTVQSTANTGRVPLRYISLLDPYYAESREIRPNVTATTDISRDSVPLRTWNRN
ncbi:MAG: cupin domain-containing protein, partial [Methanoregula sp.]